MSRHRVLCWAALGVLVAAMAGAGAIAAVRLSIPAPSPAVTVAAGAVQVSTPGQQPLIPVPHAGSFALATSLDGTVAESRSEELRPIGSVAKVMTALVVLRLHPLAPGAAGAPVTLTAADVALYHRTLAEGGSAIPVRAGEVLSERDLLLALLLPSANNIAETLARWVSGSREFFIAHLNAEASSLGMMSTRFDDPSGFSDKTESTASDLVILARAALADTALAQLLVTRSVRLPDGTLLQNLDILLGRVPGWLGLKTGWTGAAGGCLLFAATRSFAGTPAAAAITVWGAALGQPALPSADPPHPELGGAFTVALAAADAALSGYAAVDPTTLSPAVTGNVSTPWGSHSTLVVVPAGRALLVLRKGTALNISVTRESVTAPLAAGSVVGVVTATLGTRAVAIWELRTRQSISAPSWWWRVVSG